MFMINHFCEGNKAEFARMMGEKPQTINGWLNRNNGNGVLAKIQNKFPMVNPAWLYTGIGEMIDDQSEIRVRDAMAKEVNPYTPAADSVTHSSSLAGKIGSAIADTVAGTTLGNNVTAMAAMPSLGIGGFFGSIISSIFGSKDDITEEEAVEVLKEVLEDSKRKDKEIEELKDKVEYWQEKANNLEYEMSKTKAG